MIQKRYEMEMQRYSIIGCLFYILLLEGGVMDNRILVKELSEREDLKDIPAIMVLRVAIAVLEIIDSGECFFDREEVE